MFVWNYIRRFITDFTAKHEASLLQKHQSLLSIYVLPVVSETNISLRIVIVNLKHLKCTLSTKNIKFIFLEDDVKNCVTENILL
jgi:hypothetical protein